MSAKYEIQVKVSTVNLDSLRIILECRLQKPSIANALHMKLPPIKQGVMDKSFST